MINFKKIYKNYSDKIRKTRYKKIINVLARKEFSIFSSDCIGGIIYHDLGKEFTSPTINLFFREDNYSFLNFCLDPLFYANRELFFLDSKSYPKAIIYGDSTHNDINVNFMHYKNIDCARESWKKRCSRICNQRLFIYLKFKLDEMDLKLINIIDNIFVITSDHNYPFSAKNDKIHISRYLTKIGYNNGKIMSYRGIRGRRNFDDLKIMEYLRDKIL